MLSPDLDALMYLIRDLPEALIFDQDGEVCISTGLIIVDSNGKLEPIKEKE